MYNSISYIGTNIYCAGKNLWDGR